MDIVQLFEALAARGLSVVRHTGDRLRCLGDSDQLTPDLQQALQRHRDVFLSLLPSPEDRCRQIVSDAIDRANASCPPSWEPTDRQWEAMDEFQQRMHDRAQAGDVEGAKAAAAEYVRVCETCFLADAIHEWKPGAEVHCDPQPGAVRRSPPVRQADLAFDVSGTCPGHAPDTPTRGGTDHVPTQRRRKPDEQRRDDQERTYGTGGIDPQAGTAVEGRCC